MEKVLRTEIINTIRQTMKEVNEMYEERWITGKQLSEQFSMFNSEWLKRYGHLLPRQKSVVRHENGVTVSSFWSYPQHTIARMIADGEITKFQL